MRPVTVKTAGAASLAGFGLGATIVPAPQVRVTLTEAASLGTKSLLTVKVALLRVLVMVQVPTLRRAEQVPEEE